MVAHVYNLNYWGGVGKKMLVHLPHTSPPRKKVQDLIWEEQNNLKLKGLEMWLKWYSACLASVIPSTAKKRKKKKIFLLLVSFCFETESCYVAQVTILELTM
jgi:hypothetical protein